MTDLTLFPVTLLDPIDPTSQVDRMPGVDAVCEAGHDAESCRWPYCICMAPDRPPYQPEGDTT